MNELQTAAAAYANAIIEASKAEIAESKAEVDVIEAKQATFKAQRSASEAKNRLLKLAEQVLPKPTGREFL